MSDIDKSPEPIASATYDEAARWCARLQAADCSASDRAGFERWCVEDPQHIVAWLEMSEWHAAARRVGAGLATPESAPGPHRRGHRAGRRRRRAFLGLALAAAASLVLALGVYRWMPDLLRADADVHVTAVGEQRHVLLQDGSSLVLDTDSLVRVRMGDRSREIDIERGRIGITVANDERPFQVVAGRGLIKDIGTRFQVARHGDSVAVVLLEGLVDVDLGDARGPIRLVPGQEVAYGRTGGIGAVRSADLDAARAWTTGKIVFAARRLDELLVEMNRYSTRPIRLADPSMGAQTVSGVFDVHDQQGLLDALAAGWGFVAQPDAGGEIVLQRRAR